jgi:hypothetical protein
VHCSREECYPTFFNIDGGLEERDDEPANYSEQETEYETEATAPFPRADPIADSSSDSHPQKK